MRWSGVLLTGLWLAVSIAVRGGDDSDTAPRTPPRSQRVPADDPASWPPGDWQAVERIALERYLAEGFLPSAAIAEPERRLLEAHYVGRFENGVLRGECTWIVPPALPRGAVLLLSPLALRLYALEWEDAPAVWGTRQNGESILVSRPGSERASGRWALPGRQVFDDWVFDVEWPLAGISLLELDLPGDLTLESTGGIVTSGDVLSQTGLRRWRVQAGRRTTLRLTLRPAAREAEAIPVLLRESHVATLQGEGIELTTDLELTAGAPREIQLETPEGLQVISVSIGADARLPFQIRTIDGRPIVSVTWPAVARLRDERVRVRGFRVMKWSDDRPHSLPIPRLVNAIAVERQLAVHIRPPLQLQSFDADGYRLLDRRSDAEMVETWVFQGLRRDPGLAVRLAAPRPELTAHVTTWVDLQTELSRIRSRIRVQGGGSPTYELPLLCPADWDIVAVSPVSSATTLPVAGFRTESVDGSVWRRLVIDLGQPLTPGKTVELLVQAVAVAPRWGASVVMPFARIEGASAGEGLLALVPPMGAEIAAALPPRSSPPTGEDLDGLTSVATGPIHAALLFDSQRSAADGTMDTFSLEPLAPSRESLNEDQVVLPAMESSPAVTETSAALPSFSRLQATTWLAPAAAENHRHELEYALRSRFRGPCRFRLDAPGSRVEAWADGVVVPLYFSDGQWHSTGEVAAARRLTIRYQSPAARGLFELAESVPLPEWGVSAPPVDWSFVPSPTRASSTVQLPFGRVLERVTQPWTVRCFGPLARSTGDEPSAGTADPQGGELVQPVRDGILHIDAPLAPPALQFRTWNPAWTDRAAWALMMLVLLLSGFIRRRQRSWIRRLVPYLLLGLLVLTWSAPEAIARLSGAAVIGVLLVVLLPRRMFTTGQPLSTGSELTESETKTRVQVPVTALHVWWIVALLPAAIGWTQEPLPPSPSPPARTLDAATAALEALWPERDGEPTSAAYVSPRVKSDLDAWISRRPATLQWVVRDARYVVALERDARISAEFDVLVRRGRDRVPMRLDLDRVTFDSADSVLVDGLPATIIPASQGAAIILMIAPDSPDSTIENEDWSRHAVVVKCRSPGRDVDASRQVEFRVPTVASAAVRWTGSRTALDSLRVNGAAPPAGSNGPAELLTDLGGESLIVAEWRQTESSVAVPPPSRALPEFSATQFEVSPLRHFARTTFELPLSPQDVGGRWILPLSPEHILLGVKSVPELPWRWKRQASSSQVEFETPPDLAQPPLVTLDTVRPIDPTQFPTGAVPIQAVLRPLGELVDFAAVQSGAGFDATLWRGDVLAPGMEGPPPDLSARLRAALAGGGSVHRLSSGETLHLRLVPHATTRVGTSDSGLAIQRTEAQWKSVIVLDVRGAPTSLHRLQLAPEVQLQRVAAAHDDADRLSRVVRHGEFLDLILARPLTGELRIELAGRVPLSGQTPLTIPQIEVVDGVMQSTIYQVTNESGWDAELLGADQAAAPWPTTVDDVPSPMVFTDRDAERPAAVRLLPDVAAAAAELVTQFVADGRGSWVQRSTVMVRPSGAPLESLTVTIPAMMATDLSIVPAADVVDQAAAPDGGQLLTFRPSRLRGGVYRVQLQSPLVWSEQPGVWDYSPLTVTGVRFTQRWLVIAEQFPFRPTSATAQIVSVDTLPERVRPPRRGQSSIVAAVHPEAAVWRLTPYDREQPDVAVPLLETMLWSDPVQGLRGLSVLTVVSAQSSDLSLQLPAGAGIESVMRGDATIPYTQRGDRLTASLPPSPAGTPVSIGWRIEAPLQSAAALPLPHGVDWTPEQHVVAFVSTGEPALQLAAPTSTAEIARRRMTAMLAAVERQSTQVFPLDSPLLDSLRRVDGELEQQLRSESLTAEQRTQVTQLRERWQRVHELIAVETNLPGDQAAISRPDPTWAWDELPSTAAVSYASVAAGVDRLALVSMAPAARRPLAWAVAVVLLAVLIWLQRLGVLERLADWLADRPAIACLLLGVAWIGLLQPRLVGVLLLIAGITLLGRGPRRQVRTRTAESTLIRPST